MQRMDPERLYLQLNDDQRQSIAELWVASGRADMDALMDAMGNEYPYHQDEPDPASIVAEARQRIADQRAEAKARLAAEAEARGRANLKAWGLADSLEDQ